MSIGKRIRNMREIDRSYKLAMKILRDLPTAHAETRKELDRKMGVKEALSAVVSEVKELKQCYDDITSTKEK